MYQFILLIHVFAAVFVVALVLVQQGKGATMGAAFGSGASQTVFGSRGSGSFLFRLTISLVAVFFITSLGLNYLAMRAYKQERVITLPAAPVPVRQAPAEVNKQQPAAATPAKVDNTVPQPVPAATIPIRNK
jgi:preprotein translocase subunit SecG